MDYEEISNPSIKKNSPNHGSDNLTKSEWNDEECDPSTSLRINSTDDDSSNAEYIEILINLLS